MAIFDDTPPAEAGTTNNYFTQKLGPLPMWGWIAGGVVAYFLWSRYRASKGPVSGKAQAATTGSTTTTDSGANFVMLEPGATSETTPQAAPLGVPVNTPVSVTAPADVQAQQAGLAYGFLNLVTQSKGKLQTDLERATGYKPGMKIPASSEGSSKAYNDGAQLAYQQAARLLPSSDDADYYKLIGIHVVPVSSGLKVSATPPVARVTT